MDIILTARRSGIQARLQLPFMTQVEPSCLRWNVDDASNPASCRAAGCSVLPRKKVDLGRPAQSRFAGIDPHHPAPRLPISASRNKISRGSAPFRQPVTGLLWSLHLQRPRQAPAAHATPSLSRSVPRYAPAAVRSPSDSSVFVAVCPPLRLRGHIRVGIERRAPASGQPAL